MADQQQPVVSQTSGSRQRLRPGRIITLAIVFLLLGIIANLTMGWFGANWAHPRIDVLVQPPQKSQYAQIDAMYPPRPLPEGDRRWLRRHGYEHWIGNVRHKEVLEGFCIRLTHYARDTREFWEGEKLWRIECGWPWYSFGGERVWDEDVRWIPYQPIWSGFIANSLFFALLFWLFWRLCFLPKAARRAIRHRLGLCPNCSYPRGESPVCTECGARLSAMQHAPARSLSELFNLPRLGSLMFHLPILLGLLGAATVVGAILTSGGHMELIRTPQQIGAILVGALIGTLVGGVISPIVHVVAANRELRPTLLIVVSCAVVAVLAYLLWVPRAGSWPMPVITWAAVAAIAGAVVARIVLPDQTRHAHSVCPQCGYPRGESPRCTECGTLLPRS